MKRKFYNTLLNWKNSGKLKPLLISGPKKIGKTYIIDEFCKNEYEEYVYINLLEKRSIIDIFDSNLDFDVKVKKLELEIGKKINYDKAVIFFDEVQESEGLISALKSFCESSVSYKIICAGSLLGVKIHRFKSSFPVGKVIIENMYPMDFEEFLVAMDKQMWVDEIKRCYQNLEEISIHEKLLDYYRTYLCIGGMPDAIKNYIDSKEEILLFDKKIIKDIITAYLADMNKYTISTSESVKIEKAYNSVASSLAKEKNKFQYIDIEENAKRRDFETSIDWLKSSNLVYQATLVNKIEIPIKAFENDEYFKLYLSDVGILTSQLDIDFSDILLNREFMFKGAITENYVAQALRTNEIPLHYWRSSNSAEIDFVLYNSDGIIPIEVKAGNNTRSKSLNIYMNKYNPKYAIRLSTKNFGFENNIKSIPLYATFCIK